MSPVAQAGLVLFLGIVLVYAALVLRLLFMDTSPVDAVRWSFQNRKAKRARRKAAKVQQPEPQAAPEPVGEEREVPLPVDPQNMPSWKVYAPRSGASSRSCTCHPHRLLEPGQRVLWWPVPKSGGAVQVFCEEGVKLPEEERQK